MKFTGLSSVTKQTSMATLASLVSLLVFQSICRSNKLAVTKDDCCGASRHLCLGQKADYGQRPTSS